MRPLPALLALLLLAGCGQAGGADAPFVDSRIPPSLQQRFYPPETWAWGLIRIGAAPPIRYGVAAPATAPRGDVLIACGYGESAEAWFETVRALVARGYAVWVMDAPGQGGSGRFTRPRDLGHEPDPAAHGAALQAMVAVIGRPTVLIAQSTAAPAALSALAAGLPVRATILSAPTLSAAEPPISAGPAAAGAAGMNRVRLGWLRAVGQAPWEKADPLPSGRPGVIAAWQGANPDLRMGGVSYGWIDGFQRQTAALTTDRLALVRAPVLMLATQREPPRAAQLCRAMAACVRQVVPGGRASLHLESDPIHAAWTEAMAAAVDRAFTP